MKRILCVGYRDWALKIYDALSKDAENLYLIIRTKEQFKDSIVEDFQPELVLFYGWSWKVSANVVAKYNCLMLHPSPSPLYRGGSPIQNQIIAGETMSAVTIFLMDAGLDTGGIVAQEQLSLEGNVKDIFERIVEIGCNLSQQIIKSGFHVRQQDHSRATSYPRLEEKASEITRQELENASAEYLYNKVRMLTDPYPNAFIKTSDGKKLFILDAKIEDS